MNGLDNFKITDCRKQAGVVKQVVWGSGRVSQGGQGVQKFGKRRT
jgi:hypothetical protein